MLTYVICIVDTHNAHVKQCTSFFEIMAEKGHPDWVWFQQSFIVSLTRQLRGQRVNGRWVRLWKPSEAIAVLTLWTERLEQQVKPQALSDELKTILTQLIALANQVIINLKQLISLNFISLDLVLLLMMNQNYRMKPKHSSVLKSSFSIKLSFVISFDSCFNKTKS